MRADEERLAREGPARCDVLLGFLAGFLQGVEFVGEAIWELAFDVDEPRVDVRANNLIACHAGRSFHMVD